MTFFEQLQMHQVRADWHCWTAGELKLALWGAERLSSYTWPGGSLWVLCGGDNWARSGLWRRHVGLYR